jgi:hypothetical protein
VGDIGVVVGGVGEEVSGRDPMRSPGDLAQLQMPPHIGVVEATAHGEDAKHGEKGGNCRREREGSL